MSPTSDLTSLLTLLGFLFGGGFLIFLGKSVFKLGEFNNRFFNLEKRLDKLERSINTWSQKINEVVTNFNQRIGILEFTERMRKNPFYTTESPLRLTQKGEKLLQDSGFLKIYKEKKKYFLDAVKTKKPKLKYDVQQIALEVMLNFINNPKVRPLKKYAFEHGLDLIDILRAGGIYLRDRAIEELRLKE